MKRIITFLILTLICGINYGQSFDKQIQKTIILNNNFIIKVKGSEDFKNFTTYTQLILTRHNKIIYEDTTNKIEYEFGDSLYPIINKIGENAFEILTEVNDRPNKNYLKRFQIINDKLIKVDTLPTFFCTAKHLNNDSNLEYAGIWDYGEEWDDSTNQRLTVYNPIIYYKLTDTGLQLETTLTIEKNTLIYGEFKGYFYNGNTHIRVSDLGNKLDYEIDRIKKLKK